MGVFAREEARTNASFRRQRGAVFRSESRILRPSIMGLANGFKVAGANGSYRSMGIVVEESFRRFDHIIGSAAMGLSRAMACARFQTELEPYFKFR